MKLFQIYHFLLPVILLSLTTTSLAVPKYAKKGCKDTCGNVRIPFPFGIGGKCSVNEWYTVECMSSKPYLSALHHLEVVGVDLQNQTVTVKMPAISNCSQTESVDLGPTPFVYSRSQNKFVAEGCGLAVMMDNHGSVLTGCSNTCSNDTTNVIDRNKCFGISCCEATIPHYLKSYSMNLTGLESLGGDGPCGFAHLVDKNSYVQGSSSNFVKTSLLWTLSDDYFYQSHCSYTRTRLSVDLGNGTSISSWKCPPYPYGPMLGNPYLIDGLEDTETEECAKCR
nr:wall-associated kinase family protein [Tanacetum cinerariifolium]